MVVAPLVVWRLSFPLGLALGFRFSYVGPASRSEKKLITIIFVTRAGLLRDLQIRS